MLLCSILGVLLFILVVLSKPLMLLMHQPEAVVIMAAPYIDWVAFSLIPVIVYQGYKQFADGLSQTKYSMYAIFMANVVHIFFNYMLIYGVWIFPKLGILGAGLGTVISRIMMVVFMDLLLRKNKKLRKYFENFKLKNLKKSVNNQP
jgi:MATE family multidrug resistance protein